MSPHPFARVLAAALLLCVLAIEPSHAQSAPGAAAPWRIYDTQAKREVSLAEMADGFAQTDVVFFGELHDDAVAHELEDSVYALLLERYGEVALSLEMFETDVQPVVDEYLGGFVSLELLELDARAWDNYVEAYHPLVERAKSSGQAVVAANAPRRYVRLVGQRGTGALGELPHESRTHLPKRPWSYVDTAYQARFNALMGGTPNHGAPGDASRAEASNLPPIFAAQMLWDATMANSIYVQWRAGRRRDAKVFQVNGSFHSDYHQGAVAQLLELRRRLNVRTISVLGVEPGVEPEWSEYESLADFVILH